MSYLYLRLVDHLDEARASSSTNRQHVRVLAVDGLPRDRDLLGPTDAFQVRVKAVLPPSEYKGVTARACVSLLYHHNQEKPSDASQIGEAVSFFVSKGYVVDHDMTRALQEAERRTAGGPVGGGAAPLAMALRKA